MAKKPDNISILKPHGLIVLAGFVLMLGKFTAYYFTLSNAILSDALESIVNVVTGAFAFYSLWLASKPRDAEHPYGHGKIEFISATIEGVLIFLAGLGIMGKAIYNFFEPQNIQRIDIGLYVVAFAGLVNFLLGNYLVRKGKEVHSVVLEANGQHLRSDAYTTAGLLIGLGLLLFTGKAWLDNLIAILFGIIILVTGFRILRKSIAGIMDEADFNLLEEVVTSLNKHRKATWIDVHNLRVLRFGSHIHIDCHVSVPWYYSTKDSHDIISELDQLVSSDFNKIEFFIHADPCIYAQCHICSVPECPVRQDAQEKLIEWKLDNVLVNRKHGTGEA